MSVAAICPRSAEKSWCVRMLRLDSGLQSRSDLLSAPSGHQLSSVIYRLNTPDELKDSTGPIEELVCAADSSPPAEALLCFCFVPFQLVNKHQLFCGAHARTADPE